MEQSTVWIVGGVDKGNDYEDLLPLVREKVKAIVCLGEDNEKLKAVFYSKSTNSFHFHPKFFSSPY